MQVWMHQSMMNISYSMEKLFEHLFLIEPVISFPFLIVDQNQETMLNLNYHQYIRKIINKKIYLLREQYY